MESRATEKFTYEKFVAEYKDRPEKRNMSAYLYEFLCRDKDAQAMLCSALSDENERGKLGRIFNEIPSTDAKSLDEFAINYLNEIKKGNFKAYTLRKVYDLLPALITVDKNSDQYGMLTDAILDVFSNITKMTKESIITQLYAEPLSKDKILEIQILMINSLTTAISSRFTDAINQAQQSENCEYKDIVNYFHLVSGFKLDLEGKGEYERVLECTFHEMEMTEMNKIEDHSCTQIPELLNRLGNVIRTLETSSSSKNNHVQDMLESLKHMYNNVNLVKNEKGLQPDYVKQRYEISEEIFNTKIEMIGREKAEYDNKSGIFSLGARIKASNLHKTVKALEDLRHYFLTGQASAELQHKRYSNGH
jgi:hypothetical protein